MANPNTVSPGPSRLPPVTELGLRVRSSGPTLPSEGAVSSPNKAHTPKDDRAPCYKNKHRDDGVEGRQVMSLHFGLDDSHGAGLAENPQRPRTSEGWRRKASLQRRGRLISLKLSIGKFTSVRG